LSPKKFQKRPLFARKCIFLFFKGIITEPMKKGSKKLS
jgi:hypothetical protein